MDPHPDPPWIHTLIRPRNVTLGFEYVMETTPTNVNHQYLTVYSRLSGMVVDICRSLVLCLRLNPEAIKRREAVQ